MRTISTTGVVEGGKVGNPHLANSFQEDTRQETRMKDRVLYVDDDLGNLKALGRLLRNEAFHFITFDSPHEALRNIDVIKPAVVISDQCMPEMAGTLFLGEVKKRRPDSVRMILTGHADLEAAMAAINKGNVFRFIQKPWNDDQLKAEIAAALEYHEVIAGLRLLGEKGVEAALIKKERMIGVHELAVAVRHELGQSMAIISGYSYLLQDYLGKDALLHTYLSNILSQIKRMEELTTKVTSIARYETTPYVGNETMIDIEKASSN